MAQTEEAKKPGVLRRIGILVGTVSTIGLAVALVGAGSGVIAERASIEVSDAPVEPMPVDTFAITLQDSYEITAQYRGRVEAGRRVDLGFEAGGTVAEILVDEGDKVAAGQVLATLDTLSLDAQRAAEVAALDALKAQVELARRTADRQRELRARDFATDQRLDEAELTLAQLKAEVRRAEAAISATDVALAKSVLRAPFDAEIGSRGSDDGARVQPGQPLVTLFEATAPSFRIGVPAEIAQSLTEGDTFDLEINGARVGATLKRIRGDIDPATRTRDLVLELPAEFFAAEGALGTLTLKRMAPGQGAWVPTAALSEGIKGLWTLFVVEDGIAQREAVEL
ncbi:MAG: efflux RND transporter periplasmic adaptor subunit, partial [Pseudomonadota bacterium]